MKRRTLPFPRAGATRLALAALAVLALSWMSVPPPPASAAGTLPSSMLYEGYLTDASGAPVADGAYDLRFALYAGPGEPEPLWTESHPGVAVAKGFFQVHLGEGSPPAPLTLPFDAPYFLGTTVGAGPEMSPRIPLEATAYAFRARTAEEVADGSVTAAKLADGAVTDEKIRSVSWSKLTGIPSTMLLNAPLLSPGPTPSNVWSTRGNERIDATRDYLGTADESDLSLRTQGIERLVIRSSGGVEVKSPFLVEDYITSRKSPTESGFLLSDASHGLVRYGSGDVTLKTNDGDVRMVAHQARVIGSATGDDESLDSYPLVVEGQGQGLAVKIPGYRNGENNFISFWDYEGMQGRIEGQTPTEYASTPEQIAKYVYMGLTSVAWGIALGAFIDPSGIVSLGAQTVYDQVIHGFEVSKAGVTYSSGSGDYAEWLPRLREDEAIGPGDVVGVFGGRVTRVTRGAQQILPVSTSPIVLGNMPAQGEERRHEKVAFLGQVPVKVTGVVREGDFIIPSGLEDGTCVAVSPGMMTADEYQKVVGRSWANSPVEGTKLVNVVIGLSPQDVAPVLRAQDAQVRSLEARLDRLEKWVLGQASAGAKP